MNSNSNPLLYAKVLVFGDRKVGKTSLIRNIEGKSVILSPYLNSNEVYYESKYQHITSNNSTLNIQFIEINNIESNQILLPSLQYHCCLALLLYDQNRYVTFVKIKNIAHLLNNKTIHKILLANKADLKHNDIDEVELKTLLNNYKETIQYFHISNLNKSSIILLKSIIEQIVLAKDNLLYRNIITPCQIKNESISLIKIILLGDSEVGKTSFFKRVFSETFSSSVTSTIGLNDASFYVQTHSMKYKIHIWDTAGQERFRSITKAYYNKADGIIMMFDLTCLNSFLNLKNWAKDIDEYCIKDLRRCLIGNKLDLIEGRKVRFNDSVEFATEHNMLYCEVSSKWDLNVSNCIFSFIYDIYTYMIDKERLQSLTLDKYNKKSLCCF